MKRISLLLLTLFAVMALLVAACGGDDDDDDDDNGDSADTPTEASSDGDDDGDGDEPSDGGGSVDTDGEFFRFNGTGVLKVAVDGETYEYEVECEVDKGMTFDDEPQWDYRADGTDPEIVAIGTYQTVDGEPTFQSLSVIDGELFISAAEFSDVTSGGTDWAGTFTSAGVEGPTEGTFETSCS